ncbi:unnamed protein product [Urochloa humidicola]
MPPPSPREHVDRIRRFIGHGEQNPLVEDMHQAINYLAGALLQVKGRPLPHGTRPGNGPAPVDNDADQGNMDVEDWSLWPAAQN